MKLLHLSHLILIIQLCSAPPVSQNKEGEKDSEVTNLDDFMEYSRYLKEVVNALESDPDFRAKLSDAKEDDIKNGKIAEELEFVSHHVRTRLNEIKRIELVRLKELVEQKNRLENPNAIDNDDPLHHHIDNSNPHTFEIEDLKKLIAKATEDLAVADQKRKEEYKHYELEKEYKKQEQLNHTNGDERIKLEKKYKEMEEKHKKHETLHEPGHKAQLEEVWEEQDQMQQDFDPKTFFMLHDVDGNGLWDQDEVKALFINELNKMYQEGAPEDDMRERAEEMERMRESVFKEIDTNNDGFIDFNEFMKQTNSNDFKQDHGWQGLDEQRPYTDEELENYIRQHQIMNQIPQGHEMYPQVPYQQNPNGYQHQPPQGGYQQQHMPQGGYNEQHVNPGGYQQQPGGYQQQPGGYQQPTPQRNIPQGGYQQQPIPPGGYQHQVPQQGNQPAPQQGYQQAPQQGYQQVPQQQVPQIPQQIPQQGQQQVPQQIHQQIPQQGQQQIPQIHQQIPQQGQQQVPQQIHQQVPQQGQQASQQGNPQVLQHEQEQNKVPHVQQNIVH